MEELQNGNLAEVKKVGQIYMECLDEQALLQRLMIEVVIPKLDVVFAESPNKIDDAVWIMVKEVLAKVK